MNHDAYSNDYIAGILGSVKSVAIIGASANEVRPSYFVAKYLIGKGFEAHPVNPGHAGRDILGRMTFAKLADVPGGGTWSSSAPPPPTPAIALQAVRAPRNAGQS